MLVSLHIYVCTYIYSLLSCGLSSILHNTVLYEICWDLTAHRSPTLTNSVPGGSLWPTFISTYKQLAHVAEIKNQNLYTYTKTPLYRRIYVCFYILSRYVYNNLQKSLVSALNARSIGGSKIAKRRESRVT